MQLVKQFRSFDLSSYVRTYKYGSANYQTAQIIMDQKEHPEKLIPKLIYNILIISLCLFMVKELILENGFM